VCLGEFPRNREAQPRAVCAPGHKRLEQPITQRDWYSGAGIFNGNNERIVIRYGGDLDAAFRGSVTNGVDQEVVKDASDDLGIKKSALGPACQNEVYAARPSLITVLIDPG